MCASNGKTPAQIDRGKDSVTPAALASRGAGGSRIAFDIPGNCVLASHSRVYLDSGLWGGQSSAPSGPLQRGRGMTPQQIVDTIRRHDLWLKRKPGGARADLSL